jgi:hypothetical protein
MSRWLALMLTLCAVLPVQGWARVTELCSEADTCCCRRDDTAPERAVAQRIDCCEAACAVQAAPCPAVTARGDELVPLAVATASRANLVSTSSTVASAPPQTRTRGPPRALFGLVQHWLI